MGDGEGTGDAEGAWDLMLASVLINGVLGVICFGGGYVLRRWLDRRRLRRDLDTKIADLGLSVDVDCRGCGQFNRVPSHRLRDRPTCGRCKVRLMPGKRLFICRTFPMAARLRAELDGLWTDEERLWQCLADHVVLAAKARAEASDPSLRVVN